MYTNWYVKYVYIINKYIYFIRNFSVSIDAIKKKNKENKLLFLKKSYLNFKFQIT